MNKTIKQCFVFAVSAAVLTGCSGSTSATASPSAAASSNGRMAAALQTSLADVAIQTVRVGDSETDMYHNMD